MTKQLYISFDMEGFMGISHSHQAFPETPVQHTEYKHALTRVHYTFKTLFEQVPELADYQILINDAHASMRNLFLADVQLPPNVQIRSGKPKMFGMMSGISEVMSATLLLGYHAKARSLHASLAHTFTNDIADLRLNGVSLGEAGMSILLSEIGFGVPVALTYGDDALGRELKGLYPERASHVQSKQSIGWHCAQGATHDISTLIEGVKKALQTLETPFVPMLPDFLKKRDWSLELQTHLPLVADVIELLPHSVRVDGVTVQLPLHTHNLVEHRMKEVYKVIQCAYSLGMYHKFS
jgi:D-amino peptidase